MRCQTNETKQSKQQMYVAVKASCPYSSQKPPSWRRWERPDFPEVEGSQAVARISALSKLRRLEGARPLRCDELRTVAGAAIRAVVNRHQMMQLQQQHKVDRRNAVALMVHLLADRPSISSAVTVIGGGGAAVRGGSRVGC